MFRYNMKLSMISPYPTSQVPHFSIWRTPCGLTNTCQKGGFNYQCWKNGLIMFPTRINTCINTIKTTLGVISHSNYWISTGNLYTNKVESLNWHPSTAKGVPYTSGYLDHLWPNNTHPCWACSLITCSIGSQHTDLHFGQGNDTNSFPHSSPTRAALQQCW